MDRTDELSTVDSRVLADEAAQVLLEKLAKNVQLFDVRDHTSITDYYVNATGKSSTHVASLADDVVDSFELRGKCAYRVEGRKGNSWILVDFGDVILNVFDRESREFYNLDRHFPEESKLDISDLVAEVDAKFDTNKN